MNLHTFIFFNINISVVVRLKNVCEGSAGLRLLAHDTRVRFSHTVSVGLPAVRATFQNEEKKGSPKTSDCTLGQSK